MRLYNKPTTLKGWIFAFFGLYDYLKISDNEQAKEVRNRSLSSIESHLSDFDNGY